MVIAKAWQYAEHQVAHQLAQKGWIVHARNFRRCATEIDIIASKDASLVAFEVKWRRSFSNEFAQMQTLVSKRKLDAVERGLLYFLQEHPELSFDNLRIDLVVLWQERGEEKYRSLYIPNLQQI